MRRLAITVAVAASLLALGGCSASGGMSESATDRGDIGYADQGSPAVAPDRDAGGSDGSVGQGERDTIITGELTLTVENPAAAADEAASVVDDAGGHVARRSERAASDMEPGSAQLTVRIPAERLTQTLDRIKELGTARNTTLNSSDVTTQLHDLDARITALRASVDRLLGLLAEASSTEDLIAIESALSERQANLEALETQQRSLDDQVELSTITLHLISEKDTPPDTPDTFLSGLLTGWDAFVTFLAGVLVAFGLLLPWLAAVGVVAAAVLLLLRRRRRKTASGPSPAG